jgi:hypothetical protein
MLATIEDILGLSPMSIFDQRATRMWASFAPTADMRAFTVLPTRVVPFGDPGYPVNHARSPLAAASAAQDYSVPDGPDEHILNEAIWRSIRGGDSRMPEPSPGSGGGGDED